MITSTCRFITIRTGSLLIAMCFAITWIALSPNAEATTETLLFEDDFQCNNCENDALKAGWIKDFPWYQGQRAYLTPGQHFLSIAVRDNKSYNMDNNRTDAPIVWVSAPGGDYYVETSVKLLRYPENDNKQMAGIVMFEGPDWALGVFDFGVNTWFGNSDSITFFRMGSNGPAAMATEGIPPFTGYTYLRMYRKKMTGYDTYTFFYSADPESGWTKLTSYNYTGPGHRVGLYLSTGNSRSDTAQFDYFKLVALSPDPPPVPEVLMPAGGSQSVGCPALSTLDLSHYGNLFISDVKDASGGIQLNDVYLSGGQITSVGGGALSYNGELYQLLGDYFQIESGHADGGELYLTVTFHVPELLGGKNGQFEFKVTKDCALYPIGMYLYLGRIKKEAFTIDDAYLDIRPSLGQYGGGGEFKVGAIGRAFGGAIDLRSGIGPVVNGRKTVDAIKLGVGVSDLNIPIGTTGAFLQKVLASVVDSEGLSDPYNWSSADLIGDFKVTLGAVTEIAGQEIYPYVFDGHGVFSIHDGSFVFTGTGKLLGKIETANARITYNPTAEISATGDFDMGFYAGSMTAHQENGNFTGKMDGQLQVPSQLPIVGGMGLGGVETIVSDTGFYGTFKFTIVPSIESWCISRQCVTIGDCDWWCYDVCTPEICTPRIPGTYVDIDFDFDIWSGQFDIGVSNPYVQAVHHGKRSLAAKSGVADRWTSLKPANAGTKIEKARSLGASSAESQTFILESAAPALIFHVPYAGDGTADGISMQVRTPSGIVIDSSEGALPQGYTTISGFSRFHPEAKELFIYLLNPELGTYEVSLQIDPSFGEHQIQVLAQNAKPAGRIVSVGTGSGAGQYTVKWEDSDLEGKNSVKIYLDRERGGYDGFLVGSLEGAGNAGLYEFDTSCLNVPAGDYFVTLVIDDGENKPLFLVADAPISINPAGCPEAPGQVQFLAGDGSFKLGWDASATPGVSGYRVEWTDDHEDLGTMDHFLWVPADDKSRVTAEVHGLANGKPLLVQVLTVDADQKKSAPSEILRITPRGKGHHAPIIDDEADTDATVGHTYMHLPVLEDIDKAGTYTWRLANGPAGMTVDAASGLVSWTPAADQTGLNGVDLEVEELIDGQSAGLRAQKSYRICVFPAENLNGLETHNYLFLSHPMHETTEGASYTYKPVIFGPDGARSYELLAGPAGMAMDPVSGQLTWTVPAGATGAWVRFKAVADGKHVLEQDYYLFVSRADQKLADAGASSGSSGCSCSAVGL